jgi:hypothetical protein
LLVPFHERGKFPFRRDVLPHIPVWLSAPTGKMGYAEACPSENLL